ncbi:MAG: hypothetical protein E7306_03540 [Butyrivibrio sp.]|nr:hypothetical protein [Butyrivibrio sp.]
MSIKRKYETFKTYTKKAVKSLLVIGVINAEVPYVLAFLGKDPCTELGIAWITEVVAVILGYMAKAYFETKQQKKQELEDFKAGKGGLEE